MVTFGIRFGWVPVYIFLLRLVSCALENSASFAGHMGSCGYVSTNSQRDFLIVTH